MALDETLLARAGQGDAPTLRLYGWDGPWLSLGYAQPFSARALLACRAAGVRVVRRVTGGRAVLHGADLTYAVTAPEAALPGSLTASYRVLSAALLRALLAIGVAAESAPAGPTPSPVDPARFDCFAEAAADELAVGGRKLAGSAQRRAGGALLQHGSIRLAPDPPEAARVAGAGRLATSLDELGVASALARRRLVTALPESLADVLGVAFAPAPLTQGERSEALRRTAALRADPLARRADPASRAL